MRLTSGLVLLGMSLNVNIALAQEPAAAKMEDEVLIVRNHEDHRFWKSLPPEGKLKAPPYPKDLLRVGVSGCVAIGFYIEPDGKASNFRILNSIIGDGPRGKFGKREKRYAAYTFANAAVTYLSGLQFVPGTENEGRKRAFAATPASFSAEANPQQGSCQIPDLEVFLSSKMAPAPAK